MKILVLGSFRATGGIQTYNRALVDALRKSGAETAFLDRELLSKTRFAVRAIRTAFRFRPDIIACGHLYFSPLAYALSFFGFPYVLVIHGIEGWNVRSAAHRLGIQKAKRIAFISEYTKERLSKEVHIHPDKFFYLPPFVDDAVFTPGEPSPGFRERLGIPADAKVILTVARLSKAEMYKGYDNVIRSLPGVLAAEPRVRYLLIGEGDDAPRIKELIAKLGVGRLVLMPGKVSAEDLRDSYRAADVFAMPSRGEGFGIVYLEALACGATVIAGNGDGARDALLEGSLGMLVDPDKGHELSEALEKALAEDLPSHLRDKQAVREAAVAAFGRAAFERRVSQFIHEL